MSPWQATFLQLRQTQDSGHWLGALLHNVSAQDLQAHPFQQPAPESFLIPSEEESKAPLPLEAEERKLVQAFGYAVTHQKKSTRRFKEMQALHQKYPSEDLAEMLLTYCMHWKQASEAEAYGQELLKEHPDSLGLRLNLGLLALSQQQADKLPALLDHCLDWFQFFQRHPHLKINRQNIRTYHTLLCLHATQAQNLMEAVYAWFICREAQASKAELHTLSREIVRQFHSEAALQPLKAWLQSKP